MRLARENSNYRLPPIYKMDNSMDIDTIGKALVKKCNELNLKYSNNEKYVKHLKVNYGQNNQRVDNHSRARGKIH